MNRPVVIPRALAYAGFAALLSVLLAAAPRPSRASSPVASPHGSLKAECSLCHGSKGWTPAQISKKFNHAQYGFALEGSHKPADCKACHRSLEFSKAETACSSCHLDPHRGELGVACEQCHTPRSFLDRAAMTERHQQTRFPLQGAHFAVDCRGCHVPQQAGRMQFVALSTLCQSCHLAEFQSASSPNHVSGGFSLLCESCHKTVSWHAATFDHDRSGFPLTGAHRTVACATCHVGNVYAGTSRACASCHQNDYNGTTSPNHAQSGFSLQCETCHGTSSWAGAGFDHAAAGFPLTGGHSGVLCASCHVGGVYAGTSSACVSCHQNDYNGTTNPSHVQMAFPTDCQTCHSTNNWNGSFTQHDSQFFPIYSGAHRGRWTACSDCHTQPSNFAVFSCFGCHPHDNQQSTNSKHSGVNGYQYLSTACYSCHPQGRH